jgi:hypothetical protein
MLMCQKIKAVQKMLRTFASELYVGIWERSVVDCMVVDPDLFNPDTDPDPGI